MSKNTHQENEEKNDFNTLSDMPWYRPWILVVFLTLIISVLVRSCKETFKYETLTVTATPDVNSHAAHGEHNETKIVATPVPNNTTTTKQDTLPTSIVKESK